MTVISKIAGGLSLFSCIRDMHKTGVIYSNNEYAKASGDTFISCAIGTQKADKISYKDAQRKNWLLRNNFMGGINEGMAKVGGYFKGVADSATRYIPNFILSAIALCAKGGLWSNIATVGLAIVELYDFVRNSTSIFQRTDYLE